MTKDKDKEQKKRRQKGNGQRVMAGGDLLVLPKGWKGEWTIHEKVKKLFIIQQ